MRVDNEATWEAEYWDDFLKEFGIKAYVEERYMRSERKVEDAEADGSHPA
jgi:hypothetical protein